MSLIFSPRSKLCLETAKTICKECDGTVVQPIDLFLATFVSKYIVILRFISECTNSPEKLILKCNEFCEQLKRVKNKNISWSRESKKIIQKAEEEACDDKNSFVGVEHIFLSCIKNSKQIETFLGTLGIQKDSFYKSFKNFLKVVHDTPPKEKGKSPMGQRPQVTESLVDKYTTDINEKVINGDFQFFGRTDEIKNIMTALCRKQKSNILLVGEAGVGKTALVEGLALAMESPPEDADIAFVGMNILQIHIADMLSGAKYRGEFEDRLTKTLKEISNSPDKTILFIDEFHSVVGAGDNEGSLDAANILKPALADGSISCIGATTYSEYKKYIEKDPALVRRFETIHVSEPSIKETMEILCHCKKSYEEFHKVTFSTEAIKKMIHSADKYIPYRRFPDKAFDLLDEAGTYFKLRANKRPSDILKLEKELKDFLLSEDNVDLEKYTKKLETFQIKMDNWNEKVPKEIRINKKTIDTFLESKFESEKKNIDLADFLKKSIFGQDEAIEELSSLISILILSNKKGRPTGSILIVGTSGTGKTQMVKNFADLQPLGERCLIHLDMAHYSTEMSITKLIGSSAGYVGYEKGGVLTEKLKNNPNSVILFDNIEKAHPSIIDLITQMIEMGHLEDNMGMKIDCTRSWIFFTSSCVTKGAAGFGDEAYTVELNKNKFPVYLLPKIDKIITLKQLDEKAVEMVCKNHAEEVLIPLGVEVEENVYQHLCKQTNVLHGARGAITATDEQLIAPLYSFLQKSSLNANFSSKIIAKVLDNQIVFEIMELDYEK
jgi:ATP-dependent Clp protease ATP-binding subunit ClpC